GGRALKSEQVEALAVRRGRPRDDYPAEEFRRLLCEWREEHRLGLRAISAITGINRGTISQVLDGIRPCGRKDRETLMLTLGFAPDVQARFIPSVTGFGEPELILLDPPVAAHPELQKEQKFLIQGFYR